MQLVSFAGREQALAISGGKVVDARLVYFAEAELQLVPGQRWRELPAVAEDSPQDRNFIRVGSGG